MSAARKPEPQPRYIPGPVLAGHRDFILNPLFIEPGMSQAEMVFAQARYATADKTELAAALSVHELVAPTRLELAGARRRAPWWSVLYAFIRWTLPESIAYAVTEGWASIALTWVLALIAGLCIGLAMVFAFAHGVRQ